MPTLWTPSTHVIRGIGDEIAFDRDLLTYSDKPTEGTTGVPAEVVPTLSNYTTALTITAPATFTERRFKVVPRVQSPGVSFYRCWFEGTATTPGDGEGLCNTQYAGNNGTNFTPGQSNSVTYFEDCTFIPQVPHWNWDSAVVGHNFFMKRPYAAFCTDIVNVFNTTAAQPYNSYVRIEQGIWTKLAYWTAATLGVVHSDYCTHNDGIQHQGGLGTRIRGNWGQGIYAHQHAHWVATNPNGPAYNGVALQSLPAGQPYYGGPFQDSTGSGGNTIPDRGNGTEATGRYNVGGAAWRAGAGTSGSLSCILFGDEVGPSGNVEVWDNWLEGGEFCINGGGAVNPGGLYTMSFLRNKFTTDQGSQRTGGNTTDTVNFQQGENSWIGKVTCPTTGPDANLTMAGQPITPRGI